MGFRDIRALTSRTWYPLIKNYSTCRENKNTKNNKNVLIATEIIFRFGGLICFVAKNNVFDALGFVACAIFFATGGVNRKLHKRQNRERQKHYFLQQNKLNRRNEK